MQKNKTHYLSYVVKKFIVIIFLQKHLLVENYLLLLPSNKTL